MPEPTVVEDSAIAMDQGAEPAEKVVEAVAKEDSNGETAPPADVVAADGDEVADAGLQGELQNALQELRQIDDNIRSLTGRNPIEVLNFRAGRGRDVPVPRVAIKAEMRLDEVKKKFTAIEPPEPPPRGGFRRRVFEREMEPSFQPAISSSVAPAPRDPESRVKAIAELKTREKTESRQRNRRMFQNVLLGTLKQFQRDELKFERQEKRQLEVQKKLDEDERRRKAEEEEATRDLIGKRRAQQAQIRRVQRKLHLVESAKDWEEHMKKLQNFIQTAAKPPIFYLPVKHTVRTIELQRKSVKKLDDLIYQRRERLETDLKDFDANRYTDRRRSPPQPGERRRPRASDASAAPDGASGASAAPHHHSSSDTKRMRLMRGDEESEDDDSSGGEDHPEGTHPHAPRHDRGGGEPSRGKSGAPPPSSTSKGGEVTKKERLEKNNDAGGGELDEASAAASSQSLEAAEPEPNKPVVPDQVVENADDGMDATAARPLGEAQVDDTKSGVELSPSASSPGKPEEEGGGGQEETTGSPLNGEKPSQDESDSGSSSDDEHVDDAGGNGGVVEAKKKETPRQRNDDENDDDDKGSVTGSSDED